MSFELYIWSGDEKGNGSATWKTVKLKRVSPRSPRVRRMVETDNNGYYRFTDLPDGTYQIKARRCRGGGRQIVEISGGEKVNDANFECKR